LAATNQPEVLDEALVRPGRFDRTLTLSLPNRRERVAILAVHSENKLVLPSTFRFKEIVQETHEFTGADLANIMNEAGLDAMRNGEITIKHRNIMEAIYRHKYGLPYTGYIKKSRTHMAHVYHELGHAFMATCMPYHPEIRMTTIIPREQYRTKTFFDTDEEDTLITRIEFISTVTMLLAGHIAEEVILGETEMSSIGADDLDQVFFIVYEMIAAYYMTSVRPLGFFGDGDLEIDRLVDLEMFKIITYCDSLAKRHISDHRLTFHMLAELIHEKRTISGDQIRRTIELYSPVLPKRSVW